MYYGGLAVSMSSERKLDVEGVIEGILEVRCHLCDKLLTVPPLYSNEDGSLYQCGRCKDIDCGVNTRLLVYEEMLKQTTLPCTNKNCLDDLSWEEVQEHERLCIRRTMSCPLSIETCDITIECDSLVDHMQAYHPGNYCYGAMTLLGLYEKNYAVFVMVSEEVPFLIFISNDKVSVTPMKPSMFRSYNLKLSMNNTPSSVSLVYEIQHINELFDEVVHCIECFLRRCSRKWHPYSNLYNKSNDILQYTCIDENILNTVFGNFEFLLYTIKVSTEERVNGGYGYLFYALNMMNVSKAINTVLRKTLVCPNCRGWMTGPIFECRNGHTVCFICYQKNYICSLCQSLIEGRNLQLEAVANNSIYLCSHPRCCNFTGTLEKVLQHERKCFGED